MATKEILLLKPVDNLGGEGDQVKVKAGYARNYLLPQKVALPITQANRKYVESLKKARSMREAKELDKAQEIKGRIEKLNLVFTVKTGDEGRMFGAVTAGDLLARMATEGIELDKKQVSLYTPVKSLGKHSTKIRLHPDVSFDFEFDVVSEDQPVAAE